MMTIFLIVRLPAGWFARLPRLGLSAMSHNASGFDHPSHWIPPMLRLHLMLLWPTNYTRKSLEISTLFVLTLTSLILHLSLLLSLMECGQGRLWLSPVLLAQDGGPLLLLGMDLLERVLCALLLLLITLTFRLAWTGALRPFTTINHAYFQTCLNWCFALFYSF